MDSVSSLFLCADESARTAAYDRESGNTCISLPVLFNRHREKIRHGIILKKPGEDDLYNDNRILENKTIMFTTEVECETDIPDDEIYPVPKVFGGFRFSAMFSGIQFNSRPLRERNVSYNLGCPVLLLDSERLLQGKVGARPGNRAFLRN